MLLGRDGERSQIELALEQARAGESSTLAVVGEAGIGKTALLEYAAERAAGMQLLRARGIESEAQIPFAALLELVRPALDVLDQIPEPQAIALEAALALRPPRAQERFAVGAATLSLLAGYAEQAPVLVLIDDAHWLDEPSAQALLFAFRRLVADPIAVLLAVREGEPSLLDGTDLPRFQIAGLTEADAAILLEGVAPELSSRLHRATAGNPLALLELAADTDEIALAPDGAPVLVSARIADAFLRRAESLDEPEHRAVVLAATSETGELAVLERAAAGLGIDLQALSGAERAGLVSVRGGMVEFRHPLARSAIYAQAQGDERRAAHRGLAAALPDRDVDRRAWHLAAAAMGTDEQACSALEQAGVRARNRSAYATAAAAFERAARLAADAERRAQLLAEAAATAWLAGLADRAGTLLEEARASTGDPERLLDLDELAGQIAIRRGAVMGGHAILTRAAERAEPERAVAMLAEATAAAFMAGNPVATLSDAGRARALAPADAGPRTRFLAAAALGIANVLGGDAGTGAAAMREAVELAETWPELQDELGLHYWLVLVPIFLREARAGRSLLERALSAARAHAAIGVLPSVLNLIARDEATSQGWAVAEAYYREAIGLARETDQQADLAFGLAALAWLQAHRGQADECRAGAAEALELCARHGTRLYEVWTLAALGELELGLGDAAAAGLQFEQQDQLLHELGITDPDLSPAPEQVEVFLRLGDREQAEKAAAGFAAAALAKGQPWSLARAHRCQGLLADDADFPACFEAALGQHQRTPDMFEAARTRLAYGERLRRARSRVLAREQLRAALELFDGLGAHSWAEHARTELAASGETLRRRDPTTIDELTPQELQIGLLLAAGKTTRQAASTLFLSPKTVEYHLRHIYLKLDIHSREELTAALGAQAGERLAATVSS